MSPAGGDPESAALPGLSTVQEQVVRTWLPGARLVADLSWGLVDTAVLQLQVSAARAETIGAREVIVKAFGPNNHHLRRELTAYRQWLTPLRSRCAAPALHHADAEARILVIEHLPGDLVQDQPAEADPDTYRQAGELLAMLHGQDHRTDTELNGKVRGMALRWLDQDHRIGDATVRRLRAALEDHPTGPVQVVPTHGDYTPRNWLVHQGRVAVIDFGRAGWRPAQTDLARLHARQFRRDPEFEREFLRGYGADPRDTHTWRYLLLTEAIGTAAWAYQVGAESFEAEGHRMIADALAGLDG